MSHQESPDFRANALNFFQRQNRPELGDLLLHRNEKNAKELIGNTETWLNFVDNAIEGDRLVKQAIKEHAFPCNLHALQCSIVVSEVQEHRKTDLQKLMRGEVIPETQELLRSALRVFWAALPEKDQKRMTLEYSETPTDPPSELDRTITIQFVAACVRQTMFPHNLGSPLIANVLPRDNREID